MNKTLIISLVGFSLLIGCSRLDVAVNWADTYIASSVDDYFDISSSQSKELKLDLKRDIARLRKEQFPKWASQLRELETQFAPGAAKLSSEKFHTFFKETLDAGRALGPYFAATTVKFVTTATSEQLEHFEKTVREKNVEDHEKIQNSKKARQEARKKYLRWTDLWIDSLTDDQDKLLDIHLDANPFPLEQQLTNKLFVLDQFSTARKTPEKLKTFVTDFAVDRNRFNSAAFQKAMDTYQQELEKFVYQLLQTLTEKQKKHFRENLTEKAEALEKLAAKE
ncbi:MAG: hypothetical protein H7326_11690 [Bdellovibrionaceae bacterium]|nr:hypothetical protein [Pseudobdellovibrionaceae bacterium]